MEFHNHSLQSGHLGKKNILVAYMDRIMKMQSLLRKFMMVKFQVPFLALNRRAEYPMPQNNDSVEIIQVRKLHTVSSEHAFNVVLGWMLSCPMPLNL